MALPRPEGSRVGNVVIVLRSSVFLVFLCGCLVPSCCVGDVIDRDRQHTREDLTINAGRAEVLRFCNDGSCSQPRAKEWADIVVNGHCGKKVVAYAVASSGLDGVDGLYEPHGLSLFDTRVPRYAKSSPSGLTHELTLQYDALKTTPQWLIRANVTVYFAARADEEQLHSVPRSGWLHLPIGEQCPLSVTPVAFPRIVPAVTTLSPTHEYASPNPTMKFSFMEMDRKPIPSAIANLGKILHPAVGAQLGRKMREQFYKGTPFPNLVLDGLFSEGLLRVATSNLASIPLDQWVRLGNPVPRTRGFNYATDANKFTLPWHALGEGAFPEAIKNLAYYTPWTDFLKETSGMRELFAGFLQNNFASCVTSIRRGGYLRVHNDANHIAGVEPHIYRSLTVVIYLNDKWKDEWGGHLEYYNSNMTRLVHNVLPSFNRAVMWKFSGDSWHGHPEPLASPLDVSRTSLQLVYYTLRKPKPSYVGKITQRRYKSTHSAVFQVNCVGHMAWLTCMNHHKSYPKDLKDWRTCDCHYYGPDRTSQVWLSSEG